MKSHDDDLCVCFHISRQKIQKFIRLNRPTVASQVSQCYGAGTGCGWCIPFIEKLFEAGGEDHPDVMSQKEYLARRLAYLKEAKKSAERPAPPEEVARGIALEEKDDSEPLADEIEN